MKENHRSVGRLMLALGIIGLIVLVLTIAVPRIYQLTSEGEKDKGSINSGGKPSTDVEYKKEKNPLLTENSEGPSAVIQKDHWNEKRDEPKDVPKEELQDEPRDEQGDEFTDGPKEEIKEGEGKLIVIDAGHQEKGNKEQEPIGPGAQISKAKVSSGTVGISTGLREYELNLTVSMKLKEELLHRGYRVIMIRETHQVNLSNSERAAIANEAKADAFLRIHGNSSNNTEVKGVLTICQTKANPYQAELYQVNKRLSEKVLEGIIAKTGAKNRGVWETDSMSGINWCYVPVTIVEMGYLSNQEEDELLATESYQDKIVLGIADGLDAFFEED